MVYLNQSIVQLYQTEKSLGKGLGWIINSVDHTINYSKLNPLVVGVRSNYQKN